MIRATVSFWLLLAAVGGLLAYGSWSSGQLGTTGGTGLFVIGVVLFLACIHVAGSVAEGDL